MRITRGYAMKKRFFIIVLIACLPLAVNAQSPAQPEKPKQAEGKRDMFPPQTVLNSDFTVSRPSFTRKGDNAGKGEIIEVSFDIENSTDIPKDLYVFVIATYEKTKWIKDSFETKKVRPENVVIEYFTCYPDSRKNYEYEENGQTVLRKYPKDYKLGINPATGKIYTLKDKLIIRSEHLTEYRKNFAYFNNVTVVVYDDDGILKYRQTYALEGRRH